MVFSSMWPLAFLAVIPIIIILYLLKPRGTDTEISSNILWEKLFKNVSSKTFFEKFVQDLLMYLQILIMIILVLALMAPQIMLKTTTGGSAVLLSTIHCPCSIRGQTAAAGLTRPRQGLCPMLPQQAAM